MTLGRVELALAFVLSALVVVPLFFLDFVPTMDGPHHLLHGVILNHWDDASRGYQDYLEPGAPITSLGFGWLFCPLETVLGWRAAYASVLGLIALGWSWSVRFLIHAIAGKRTPWGLLGFCFAFSWPLYMGFLPFCISGVLGVVAMGLAATGEGRIRYVGLTSLLLLSALAHVFPAAICGVAALALAVARAPEPRKEALRLVACGLPAALVAVLAATSGSETVASRGMESGAYFWSTIPTRLLDLGRTSIGGPLWRWGTPLALALGGAALAMKARKDRTVTTAALLSVAFILLALVSPLHMTAWEYFSPRALLFALSLGVSVFAAIAPRTNAHRQLAASFTLAAGCLGWAQTHNANLAGAAEPALAGLDTEVARDGWRLPINLDVYGDIDPDAVIYAKPLTNLGLVYAAEQGGVVPYLFASSPSVHPSIFQAGLGGINVPERSYYDALSSADWQQPGRLEALRTSLLADGSAYQDIIVWGDPELVQLLPLRGFVTDFADSQSAIARFEGCRVTISAETAPGAEGLVQWGWYPLDTESGRSRTRAQGTMQTAEILAPCGPAWLRLAIRSGETTYVCEGSTPDGRLLLDVVPDQGIQCELRPYTPPTDSQ